MVTGREYSTRPSMIRGSSSCREKPYPSSRDSAPWWSCPLQHTDVKSSARQSRSTTAGATSKQSLDPKHAPARLATESGNAQKHLRRQALRSTHRSSFLRPTFGPPPGLSVCLSELPGCHRQGVSKNSRLVVLQGRRPFRRSSGVLLLPLGRVPTKTCPPRGFI